MNAELLSGIVGIAISLALSYIPGLRERWNALGGDYKRAIIGVLLVVAAGAVYGLSCAGWVDIGISCDREGLCALLGNLVAALVANQSIYVLTHKERPPTPF